MVGCAGAGKFDRRRHQPVTLRRLLDVTAGPASVRFVEESCRSFATLAFADAEGRATLREAADINKSLFTLRKAIEHLALKRHTRSVFQEETLTKMLVSGIADGHGVHADGH